MTITPTDPANPRVAAMRQDAATSYDALNQLIDGRLADLAPEKLYQEPAHNEWTIMENLAHVVEFMPYWANEVANLLTEPGRSFGRIATDERRIKEIADHAHDNLEQIKAMLPISYARLQEVLASLRDSDLAITGKHIKYGEKTLASFIEDYITGHLRAHNQQIEEAMQTLR
jgi:uncharacterized damage-inducible protein DinB